MKGKVRYVLLVLLVLIALAIGTGYWLNSQAKVSRPRAADTTPEDRSLPPLAAAPANVAVPTPTHAAIQAQGSGTPRQAYRLAVHGGVIRLDAVQPLRGNFHQRRGPIAWQPGMWCVRLLDADLRVLAQETAPAPDEPCVVQDPNVLTATGAPQVAIMTATGEAVMQVRLPTLPEARWIRVYKIAGSKPVELQQEPLGRLLASLPLPP